MAALGFALALILTGCSGGTETGGLGTLDDGASKACAGLQNVMANRASLPPDQLRERLGAVYQDAQSSSNAIIQARAVALYADATVMASGGEPGSLLRDLDAMQKACSGGTGS